MNMLGAMLIYFGLLIVAWRLDRIVTAIRETRPATPPDGEGR